VLASLPGIGHAPTLTEPEVLVALRTFVAGVESTDPARNDRMAR
jgi:hypothetical protein